MKNLNCRMKVKMRQMRDDIEFCFDNVNLNLYFVIESGFNVVPLLHFYNFPQTYYMKSLIHK